MVEYIFKAAACSVFTLLTWLLSPLLALWPRRLPWCLVWFGQYDDDLQGSFDPGWQSKPWVMALTAAGALGCWLVRICWICRNPAQYFDYWILGIPVWDGFSINVEGNIEVVPDRYGIAYAEPTDRPFCPGWIKKTITNFDGRKAWFYRRVFKWPLLNRCCDIKLGYAVWDSIKAREKAKLVFTPLSFSKMED